jgi:hypothetical protein
MRHFYTCKDGKERTNIRITIRLTKEELIQAKALAKKHESEFSRWASGVAGLAIEQELAEADEDEK